jgi:hypothetical protein
MSHDSGAVVWGEDDAQEQLIKPLDFISVWQQALQGDPEKRLLLILDFPHTNTWVDQVIQSGCTHLTLKHFAHPASKDPPNPRTYPYLQRIARFLFLNLPGNPTSWLTLIHPEKTSLDHHTTLLGDESQVVGEFSLRVTEQSVPYYIPGCVYQTGKGFNTILKKKEQGVSETHGYCQLRNPTGRYLWQGLWDHGVFVKRVDPKFDSDGRYLGEYKPDESCVLYLIDAADSSPGNVIRVPKERMILTEVVTQRVFPDGREVDFSSKLTRNLPPVFELLNGKAEFRYDRNGKLLLREKGTFKNGILDGEGSRISLIEETVPAKELGKDGPEHSAKEKGCKKGQHRKEESDQEVDEQEALKQHRKYKGQFENGNWIKGVIKFGAEFEYAQFRGSMEGSVASKGTLVGKMVLKSGFRFEGRFSLDGSPIQLRALYGPEGTLIENGTLYNERLTGNFTCVGEKWTDVVVGEFKNGHLVGPSELYNYEGKF